MTAKIFENEDELSNTAKMQIMFTLLADTRKRISELEEEKTEFEKAHPGFVSLLSDLAELRKNLKDIYNVILSYAIEVYKEAGEKEKKLNEWVTITEKEAAKYDSAQAVKWAIEKKLPTLLSIDDKEFLAVAKTLGVDFVEYSKEYGMRLAKDLSSWESVKRLELEE